MHELSIAENIVEIVKENLAAGHSVKSVKVKIGELANVIPDSLEFCFGVITKGTPLENTRLEIENVDIVAHCEGCGTDSGVEGFLFQCKNCGSTDLKIISGNELQVVEFQVDDEIEEST
ncbi:MAG: hydrogenase maturation nickel metallochaperone HypA [Candidatus Kryptoniota bacterium]